MNLRRVGDVWVHQISEAREAGPFAAEETDRLQDQGEHMAGAHQLECAGEELLEPFPVRIMNADA